MNDLDVVIVSYRRRSLLLDCCASVREHAPGARIIVVDNASADGSVAAVLAAHPDATVIAMASNLGFATAANRGVAAGQSPWILLLNPDARLTPGALPALHAALAADPGAAAAGPRIRGNGGELELSVGRTMSLCNDAAFKFVGRFQSRALVRHALERRYRRSRDTNSLSGACLLARRDAWEQVGGMDEAFFLYAEDVDLCRRWRTAGWRLRYVAEAEIHHQRGAAASLDPGAAIAHYRDSQRRFYAKHRSPAQQRLLSWWHGRRHGRRTA